MPAQGDLCITIQQSLNNIARHNLPALKVTPVGTLDALLSPQNRNGFEIIRHDTGDGKKKKVVVRYIQPMLAGTTFNTPKGSCAGELEVLPLETTFEVTKYRRSSVLTFNNATMKTFCESTEEHKAQVVGTAINALKIAINADLIAQFVADAGEYADGTLPGAPKSFTLINQDTGGARSAEFWGESELMEEFVQLEAAVQPLVVGAGLLSHYTRMQDIGCCNKQGQKVDEFGDSFNYFRDQEVASIIGTPETFIAWVPGSFQFVNFLHNKGDFRDVSNPHHQRSTLTDPISGLEFDTKINFDGCSNEEGIWTINISSTFDLHPIIVSDAYPVGHPLEDTNGGLICLAAES